MDTFLGLHPEAIVAGLVTFVGLHALRFAIQHALRDRRPAPQEPTPPRPPANVVDLATWRVARPDPSPDRHTAYPVGRTANP